MIGALVAELRARQHAQLFVDRLCQIPRTLVIAMKPAQPRGYIVGVPHMVPVCHYTDSWQSAIDSIRLNEPMVPWLLLALAAAPCSSPAVVQLQGAMDNFAYPPKPVTLSPKMTVFDGYAQYEGAGKRQYDDRGQDKIFATSFPLVARKLCSAQIEIRMRRKAGDLSNESLTIGFAPFLGDDRLDVVNPWAGIPVDITDRVLRLDLPVGGINRRILLGKAPYFLDIFLHDDTAVDYIKLTVHYE